MSGGDGTVCFAKIASLQLDGKKTSSLPRKTLSQSQSTNPFDFEPKTARVVSFFAKVCQALLR